VSGNFCVVRFRKWLYWCISITIHCWIGFPFTWTNLVLLQTFVLSQVVLYHFAFVSCFRLCWGSVASTALYSYQFSFQHLLAKCSKNFFCSCCFSYCNVIRCSLSLSLALSLSSLFPNGGFCLICSANFNLYSFPPIAISSRGHKLESLFSLGQCDSCIRSYSVQHTPAYQAGL
jgi:hypothetical protein